MVKAQLKPARDGALSGPPSPTGGAAETDALMEHLTVHFTLSYIHPTTRDANIPTQEASLRMTEGLGDSHMTVMLLIGGIPLSCLSD